MKIVGLDTSLTRTGVAVIDSERKSCEAFSIVSKPLRKTAKDESHTLSERFDRLETIMYDIRDRIAGGAAFETGIDLAVIEGPAYSRANAGTFERYGLWWMQVQRLRSAGIAVAVCGPTTRAKWATGKGNAGKDEVMLALDRLWPNVASNNDEADGLALATIGAQMLGWPVPTLNRHLESLRMVEWPPDGLMTLLNSRTAAAMPGVLPPVLPDPPKPAAKRTRARRGSAAAMPADAPTS